MHRLISSSVLRRSFHVSTAVLAKPAAKSAAAATNTNELVLNFAVPHKTIVSKKAVQRVTVPGRAGALGIEKNAPAMLTELRPGVVRVDYEGGASDELFVPGGFFFKHVGNTSDLSATRHGGC